MFAARLRLTVNKSRFAAEELRRYAAEIHAAAAEGKFTYEVRVISTAQRPHVFDLFEAHAFHCHSLSTTVINVCWDPRCKRDVFVDSVLLDEFVHGDEIQKIAVNVHEVRSEREVRALVQHMETESKQSRTNLRLDAPVSDSARVVLWTMGVHVSDGGALLCWRWKCLADGTCGSDYVSCRHRARKLDDAPSAFAPPDWLKDHADHQALMCVVQELQTYEVVPAPEVMNVTDANADLVWPFGGFTLTTTVTPYVVVLNKDAEPKRVFEIPRCMNEFCAAFWDMARQ